MQRIRLVRGAMLPCLLLLLASCASNPVAVKTVTVKVPAVVAVPSVLTQPVPEPKLAPDPITNRDVADWALALRQALREANAKLQQIAGLHGGD